MRPPTRKVTVRAATNRQDWLKDAKYDDLGPFFDFNNWRGALPAWGPEKLTNGDFSQGATGWTDSSTGTGSTAFTGNQLTVNRTNSSNKGVSNQAAVTTVGSLYEVTATVVSGTAFFGMSTGGGNFTSGPVKFYFTAANSNQNLSVECVNDASSCVVDSISVREVILTREGKALGPNLVVNGDFAANVTGWTAQGSGGVTFSWVSGALQMVRSGNNSGLPGQTFSGLTIGRKYRLMFTSGISPVAFQTFTSPAIGPTDTGAVGFKTYEFTATTTTELVGFWPTNDGTTATIDNIEFRELPSSGAFPKRAATFDEFFAFSAPSTIAKTYVDQNLCYKNDLPADKPRRDWRNGKQQFRLEDQRINSIRNPIMTGATASTLPNLWDPLQSFAGVAANVVGIGVENGFNYLDVRCNGTNTSGSTGFGAIFMDRGGVNGIPVVAGATWAVSSFVKLVGGSLANLQAGVLALGWNEYDVAGAYLRTQVPNSFAPTSSFVRNSGAVAIGASATFAQPNISFSALNGAAIDFTIRIYLPQFEIGAFTSDPIMGNLTRAIETARFSPLVEAIMQRAAGSAVVRGKLDVVGASQRIMGFNENGGNGSGMIAGATGNGALEYNESTLLAATLASGTHQTGFGQVVAYDSAGRALAANGSAVSSDTATPGARTLAKLASSNGQPYAFGNYDFVGISPERLTDAKLQALAVAA